MCSIDPLAFIVPLAVVVIEVLIIAVAIIAVCISHALTPLLLLFFFCACCLHSADKCYRWHGAVHSHGPSHSHLY